VVHPETVGSAKPGDPKGGRMNARSMATTAARSFGARPAGPSSGSWPPGLSPTKTDGTLAGTSAASSTVRWPSPLNGWSPSPCRLAERRSTWTNRFAVVCPTSAQRKPGWYSTFALNGIGPWLRPRSHGRAATHGGDVPPSPCVAIATLASAVWGVPRLRTGAQNDT